MRPPPPRGGGGLWAGAHYCTMVCTYTPYTPLWNPGYLGPVHTIVKFRVYRWAISPCSCYKSRGPHRISPVLQQHSGGEDLQGPLGGEFLPEKQQQLPTFRLFWNHHPRHCALGPDDWVYRSASGLWMLKPGLIPDIICTMCKAK